MDIPPNLTFFIEKALLRLGKEIVDGLDREERTERAKGIVENYYERRVIDKKTRDKLVQCWQDLLFDCSARDIELSIREREGKTETDDVHRDTYLCYVNFCQCVGDCLDILSVA